MNTPTRWLLGLAVTACLFVAPLAHAILTTVVLFASGLTTNTTTSAISLPAGNKTIVGHVICTSGACEQTQDIFGDDDGDSANGTPLCTITLSGNPRADYACPVITASFAFYYVTTSLTSGTGATGHLTAGY